jgi:hypothetical protein
MRERSARRFSISQLPNFPITQLFRTRNRFQITNYRLPNYKYRIPTLANTSSLSKDDRKKAKRASRKKRKTETPLKPRDYARGSKKSKVKKLARGQSKRG